MINVYFPKPYLKGLDRLVINGHFPNRAEAIRLAVRDLLVEYKEFKVLRK